MIEATIKHIILIKTASTDWKKMYFINQNRTELKMFWTLYMYALFGMVSFLLLNLVAFQRSYPTKTGLVRLLCWWRENYLFIAASFMFVTAMVLIMNVMEQKVEIKFIGFVFGKRAVCLLMGFGIETVMNLARRIKKPIKNKSTVKPSSDYVPPGGSNEN